MPPTYLLMYWIIAADSLGGLVAQAIQMPHPAIVATNRPLEKQAQPPGPPAAGRPPPRAAITSAISASTIPPMIQETIASGPAYCAAYIAPSSHPDPITPENPIAVSCQYPSDRCRRRSSPA